MHASYAHSWTDVTFSELPITWSPPTWIIITHSIWSCLWMVSVSFGWFRMQWSAIFHKPRLAHVSPHLWELYWLPICFPFQLKILVITFNALQGLGPDYLKDHSSPFTSTQPTRMERQDMLQVPSIRVFIWWEHEKWLSWIWTFLYETSFS